MSKSNKNKNKNVAPVNPVPHAHTPVAANEVERTARIDALLVELAAAPKSSNAKKSIRRKLRALEYRLSKIKRTHTAPLAVV